MSKTKVTWQGREVTNPFAREALTFSAALAAASAICFVVLMLMVVVATFPIWVPIDLILKWRGRKGFIQDDALIFGREAFKRTDAQPNQEGDL